MNDYLLGTDVLGEDYGPVSPAQLAQLDRKLTSAEQAAVDAYQEQQANEILKKERGSKKRTAIAKVDAKPEMKVSEEPTFFRKALWEGGPIKIWHAAGLGAVGLIATGVALAVRR